MTFTEGCFYNEVVKSNPFYKYSKRGGCPPARGAAMWRHAVKGQAMRPPECPDREGSGHRVRDDMSTVTLKNIKKAMLEKMFV